jgi:hypothetical protein
MKNKPLSDCGLTTSECKKAGYCNGHVLTATNLPAPADSPQDGKTWHKLGTWSVSVGPEGSGADFITDGIADDEQVQAAVNLSADSRSDGEEKAFLQSQWIWDLWKELDMPTTFVTFGEALYPYMRRRELESQLQLLGNLGYDRRLDDPILFCGGNEAYPREQRLQELQAELDKLTEGRGE